MLFACPSNVLAQTYCTQEYKSGVTLNEFFGIGLTENSKVEKRDDTNFDVIVFDEIFMSSMNMLRKIRQYVETHQNKIIIATGDTDQNEGVDVVSSEIEFDEYMNRCMDIIFPFNVFFSF